MLDWSIGIMICFLNGSLVVILIWDLTNFDMLRILLTFIIFLRGRLRKASLIWMMSSIFYFEAWAYNFLLLVLVSSFNCFGLAKYSLLSWEGTIIILLNRIGAAWGNRGTRSCLRKCWGYRSFFGIRLCCGFNNKALSHTPSKGIIVFIHSKSIFYDLKLKVLSNKTTLVLSNTRELDRVPNTK